LVRVSVGIPVYNGERFLEPCLDAIFSQTLQDIEVILADNASTDRTQEICLAYQKKYPNFIYYRHPENMGAARNYDFCFHKATGQYFKWAAHDDLIAPSFLEKAVAAIDADPAVVGAHALTHLIDAKGQRIDYDPARRAFVDRDGRTLRSRLDEPALLDDGDPVRRLRAMLKNYRMCTAVFGVYRRDVMAASGLHLPFWGSDKVFIGEMLLHGKIAIVPEELFLRRTHVDQASNLSKRDQARWLKSDKRYRPFDTQLAAFRAYMRAIERAPLSHLQKLKCCALVMCLPLRLEKWTPRYLGLGRARPSTFQTDQAVYR